MFLKNYNRGMIVLAGASASGKTEVAKELAKKYGITKVITTTTRDMRVNEVNGRDYFFVTKEEFERMVQDGRFVEYTYFNDNLYGSTKDQISANKCVVIDPAGLRAYIGLKDPSIVTFFLDTTEQKRYQRMLERGDEEEKAKKRILHDREAFKPENIANVDFHINTEYTVVDEVCDDIYNKYKKTLQERGLLK